MHDKTSPGIAKSLLVCIKNARLTARGVGIFSRNVTTLENKPIPLIEEPTQVLRPWAYLRDYGNISLNSGLCCSMSTLLMAHTDAVAFSRAHFGAGTGTIYLDNVGCTGSETRLIDCSRSTTVSCFSGHSEDAGVRCQGLEKWSTDIEFFECPNY